jgi:trigger factor
VERIASSAKRFEDAEEGKAAETGDQLIIDFVGKLDGVEFDGGKAEDAALEIGSGRFIPGFEEQLVGAKAVRKRPSPSPSRRLSGRASGRQGNHLRHHREVGEGAGETVIDDEFAKSLGLTDLDQLKTLLRGSWKARPKARPAPR